MKEFRALRADEVDVRIGQAKDNGVALLLYKDARCDMAILDETVGPMNWQRKHSRENANCTVEIWDDGKKQWIAKEDTGTESNTEAEKGLASDSFKRACVNWGIGRELYTAPFIWVSGADKYAKFWVQNMVVENKRITSLVICRCDKYGNKTNEVAYTFPRMTKAEGGPKTTPAKKTEAGASPRPTEEKIDVELTPMRERVKSIYRGAILDELLNKYNVLTVADLSKEQLETILSNYDAWQAKKKEARAG